MNWFWLNVPAGIFFVAAWFALSFQPKAASAGSRPNSPAARH